MPVKRRAPKGRQFVPTEEILELYARAKALVRDELAYVPDADDLKHGYRGQPTDEMREISQRLYRLTDSRPWLTHVLDLDDFGGIRPDLDEHALNWRDAIERALKERRRGLRRKTQDSFSDRAGD
jgi:hypothetical protein